MAALPNMRVEPEIRPTPIETFLSPFQEFARNSAAGGILLIFFTIVALVWANSPWAASYTSLFSTIVTVGAGEAMIAKPLILWINDGLMAIFFFVVGLEIKREVLVGELSSVRSAALPIAAAIGGIAAPGAIYALMNLGGAGLSGWAIPAATDIAFALGVLALLGSRVPVSLKVFLTAVAIVDDIGAVLIIALFYTASVSAQALLIGGIFLLALIVANRLGIRSILVYSLLSIGLWVAFLKSWVHATIAGILAAMTIPTKTRMETAEFGRRVRALLDEFRRGEKEEESIISSHQRGALQAIEDACNFVDSPAHRLEHGLHTWVVFAIMPIFALANAGVALGGDLMAALTSPVTLGIILGLVIGKQIGITGMSWIATRIGIAERPGDVSWGQIYGVSWLAGIGFTMSLFITPLAFDDPTLQTEAKVGILGASIIAGTIGYILLRRNSSTSDQHQGEKESNAHSITSVR